MGIMYVRPVATNKDKDGDGNARKLLEDLPNKIRDTMALSLVSTFMKKTEKNA